MLIGAFYTFGESLAFIAQSVNNDPLPSPPPAPESRVTSRVRALSQPQCPCSRPMRGDLC